MPENKITAPVLAHRNGLNKNLIMSIIPLEVKGIKCAVTFSALALAVCTVCGVCALASGGGCDSAVGTLASVVGCNAAIGVMKALK